VGAAVYYDTRTVKVWKAVLQQLSRGAALKPQLADLS
jgi:hypothetical protein